MSPLDRADRRPEVRVPPATATPRTRARDPRRRHRGARPAAGAARRRWLPYLLLAARHHLRAAHPRHPDAHRHLDQLPRAHQVLHRELGRRRPFVRARATTRRRSTSTAPIGAACCSRSSSPSASRSWSVGLSWVLGMAAAVAAAATRSAAAASSARCSSCRTRCRSTPASSPGSSCSSGTTAWSTTCCIDNLAPPRRHAVLADRQQRLLRRCVIVAIWRLWPFAFLMLMAGLQSIPRRGLRGRRRRRRRASAAVRGPSRCRCCARSTRCCSW